MTVLIEPDLGRVSGGLRYNRAVAQACHGAISLHPVAGAWPEPSADDDAALRDLVARTEEPIIVDGLIGCSVAEPLRSNVPVVQLVHAPLAVSNPAAADRERANLTAASAVVTTSRHAAEQVRELYNVIASVAEPGVVHREAAVGTETGMNLVCVGAIEENKNQVFLARVLAALLRAGVSGWHCTFAGPTTDPAYYARLRDACASLPPNQVRLAGELGPEQVDELYRTSDLLLLASQRETYGMVVTEAAAAAIPALVTAGTGAQEALAAGAALPLEHDAWVNALTRWLTDAPHRARWREEAARRRPGLRTWQDTADALLAAVPSGLRRRAVDPSAGGRPR